MAGSGGGGASGKVDYPHYLKHWHAWALQGDTDEGLYGTEVFPNICLGEALNDAMDGVSPYSGIVVTDPEDAMFGVGHVITDFTPPFTRLVEYGLLDFDTLFATYQASSYVGTYVANKDTRVAAMLAAESDMLDDEINVNVLPQFQAGMRDINAVMSSAFVIGESNIWSGKVKAMAKNDAIIRWEAEKYQGELSLRADDFAMRQALAYFEIKKSLLVLTTDLTKAYVVMKGELDDWRVENDAKDRLWDLKCFQYGGNFLGSIAGSAVSTDKGDGKSNKMASTAGGAISGAGAGAMMGSAYPGVGTAIGAVVGGLVGYFSS